MSVPARILRSLPVSVVVTLCLLSATLWVSTTPISAGFTPTPPPPTDTPAPPPTDTPVPPPTATPKPSQPNPPASNQDQATPVPTPTLVVPLMPATGPLGKTHALSFSAGLLVCAALLSGLLLSRRHSE